MRGLARALECLVAALLAMTGTLAAGCAARHDGRTVVRFWGFGREGEVVRALVPDFERTHPTIRVEVQQIPWTAAHEKLLTAFVGRSLPDAAQLGNTWIAELAALGALAPLDARLARSPGVARADFFPGAWDGNVVERTTWGIPWYVDTRLLFYRRDLVARSGAKWPPRSWAEWRDAMVKVKALPPAPGQSADRYAIVLPIDEWTQPVIFGMQTGAPMLDTSGTHGEFRDPRFRRAMTFYMDLYRSKLAPPLDASGLVNLYQQFAQGYFAMVITGPWNLGEFRNRIPPSQQDEWATAPLPPPDADMPYPGASIAGGSSLVLLRGGDAATADAAWQWLEYLAAPAQQARFYAETGDLPARRSAWERTDLVRDPRAAPFLAQMSAAVPLPKVPEWEQIATAVTERCEQMMRGGRSLDAALAGLDADADRMLEKRRWLLSRGGKGG